MAAAAADPANLPDGMAPGLDGDGVNRSDLFTFPNGCHAAEVEIDPETGLVTLAAYTAVDDYGRLVNPLLTAGQVHGGVAQGIGQAMLEHTVYERRIGPAAQRLADGLRAAARRGSPGVRSDPGGIADRGRTRSGSRAPVRPAASLRRRPIVNAILDALAPFGIDRIDMPATPERIWRAIRDARDASRA